MVLPCSVTTDNTISQCSIVKDACAVNATKGTVLARRCFPKAMPIYSGRVYYRILLSKGQICIYKLETDTGLKVLTKEPSN